MNSELFEMNKFNVLEDENYYYVYRALNKADHADALNHFYETKQDIERIRTDRERYEEEHGKAKYDKESEISLEEIYDHIKIHYLKETNCISLSTNANVSLDYGSDYFDEYAVIKVPKTGDQDLVYAGDYMLFEVYLKIEEALQEKNIDKSILDIINRIDDMENNNDIVNIISILCKDRKFEKNIMSRFQNKQYFTPNQQLEYNKLIAKLTILEVTGIMPSIISENETNQSLLATIGGAFSSGEVIHYKDIPRDKFQYTSKRMMNLFAIIQQLKEKHPDNEEIKNLESKVLEMFNKGYDIKNINNKIVFTNGTDTIDCHIDSKTSPIFYKKKLDNNLLTIEEVYNITGGSINYTQAKIIIEFCYYLAQARREAYDYSDIITSITGNTNLSEMIINETVPINNKIIDRINNNGYKICESVNLGIEDKYANFYSSSNQKKLIDLLFNFDDAELDKLLTDGGITLSYSIINNIQKNSPTSKNEYYATSIIDNIDFDKIYKNAISKEKVAAEKEKLSKSLGEYDISRLYQAFKNLDLSHEAISYYIFNLFLEKKFKGKTFEEICNMSDIDKFIDENKAVFNVDVNVITLNKYLGIFEDMNYVENSNIILRDYQQRIKNEVDGIYSNGRRFAGIVLPTGGGKSFIAMAEMLERKDKKIIYLAPRLGILRNFKKNIVEYVAGLDPEGLSDKELDAIVKDCFPYLELICYQSLTSTDEEKIASLNADFIIMDEIHHIGGKSWNKCIKKLLDNNPNSQVLGISATPERDEYEELEGEDYFDMHNGDMMKAMAAYLDNYTPTELMQKRYLACDINVIDAIQEGYVVCPNIVSYDYYLDTTDEYNKTLSLFKGLKDPHAKAEARQEIEKMLSAVNSSKLEGENEIIEKYLTVKDGKYILFLPRKPRDYEGTTDDYFEEMIDNFKTTINNIDKEPHIEYIHSGQSKLTTEEAMQRFETDNSDHMKILVAVDMLNEGVHLPNLNGSFNQRKIDGNHLILSLQHLGRVIYALDPNKELTESDIPIVFDKYNNYMNLDFDRLVNKKTIISDLEKLKGAIFWIDKYGTIPNAESANSQEVRKAVTLLKIRQKYSKYRNDNLDEHQLNDYEKYNVEEILKICNEYDVWNMKLGTITNERIRKIDRVNIFNVSANQQTFLEACKKIKGIAGPTSLRMCDRIKLYMKVADILTENGIILSPKTINANMTINSLLGNLDESIIEDIKYELSNLGYDTDYPIYLEYVFVRDCFHQGKSLFSGYDYNLEDITNLRKFGILYNETRNEYINEKGFIINGPKNLLRKNIWTGTYYDKNNCNIEGYDQYGFNQKTKVNIYTNNYYDQYGFNIDHINIYTNTPYDNHGFNIDHIHKDTNTEYDEHGFNIDCLYIKYDATTDSYIQTNDSYDEDGYDINGYNKRNFDRNNIHRVTGLPYDELFFDKDGFYWELKNGKRVKTNRRYNEKMFDRDGYMYEIDERGNAKRKGRIYDSYGFRMDGTHHITQTKIDPNGYDATGIWYKKVGNRYESTGSIFNDKGWTRDNLTTRHNAYGLTIDEQGNLMLDKVDDYGFDFMGRYHYPVDEVDNDGFKTIHRGYIEYSNRIMSKGKIHGMYHDIHGFNREGISKDTGTFLNQYNFDRNGYWWKKDENGELVNTYSYVSDDGWTIDKKRIVNIDGKEIYTNLDERGFNIDHYYRPSPSAQKRLYDNHGFDYQKVNYFTGTHLNSENFDADGFWWKKDENNNLVKTDSKINDEGWDIDHVNEKTGRIVDEHGFDSLHLYRYRQTGKNKPQKISEYDPHGFDYRGIHRTTGKVYNNNHFDIDGYWYRKEGKEYVKTDSKYDEDGLDIDRRDKNEFTKNGYFKNTRKKYNSDGFMKDEVHSITNQKYDLSGKDINGEVVADADKQLIRSIKEQIQFDSRKYIEDLIEEYNLNGDYDRLLESYDEYSDEFEIADEEINSFIQFMMLRAIKKDETLYTEDELYEYLKESAKEFKLQIKNDELEEMMKYYHEAEQTYGGRESYPGDNLITHL